MGKPKQPMHFSTLAKVAVAAATIAYALYKGFVFVTRYLPMIAATLSGNHSPITAEFLAPLPLARPMWVVAVVLFIVYAAHAWSNDRIGNIARFLWILSLALFAFIAMPLYLVTHVLTQAPPPKTPRDQPDVAH